MVGDAPGSGFRGDGDRFRRGREPDHRRRQRIGAQRVDELALQPEHDGLDTCGRRGVAGGTTERTSAETNRKRNPEYGQPRAHGRSIAPPRQEGKEIRSRRATAPSIATTRSRRRPLETAKGGGVFDRFDEPID